VIRGAVENLGERRNDDEGDKCRPDSVHERENRPRQRAEKRPEDEGAAQLLRVFRR
jgi:hypothetical protein